MSKSIIEMVHENPDYQRALSLAPDADRARIEERTNHLIGVMQSLADKLKQVAEDPDAREKLREALKGEMFGVKHGT